jgi:hypothetical protein
MPCVYLHSERDRLKSSRKIKANLAFCKSELQTRALTTLATLLYTNINVQGGKKGKENSVLTEKA